MTRRRGRGEGNIRQRSDGRWEARITLPDGGGSKSIYAKTRTEARAKLTAALREMDMGAPLVKDERLTVERYLGDWLERKRATIKPRSIARYRELMIHVSRAVGGMTLTKLTVGRLERLYADLQASGLSATTVHQIHTVFSQALGDAQRLGLVARNVAERRNGVKPPRIQQAEMRPLDREQARTLLAAAQGDRLEALYVLALATGMREGELLALRWRDVALDDAHLQVRGTLVYICREGYHIGTPKSKKSRRRIDLSAEAVAALRRHKARQAQERLTAGALWGYESVAADLVFCTEVGHHLNAGSLSQRALKRLLARAGLPIIRFHDLRHTFATLALLNRVHPKIVSEMLGHSSVSITLDRYSHVLPGMGESAVAALDKALFA